ncbi:hypothetical protein Tco_0872917 [Tanacetum coccineum]
MHARLDALSIDFDEELYPHMLTAIVGRRWVIGRGQIHGDYASPERSEVSTDWRTKKTEGRPHGYSYGVLILGKRYRGRTQWIRDLRPNSSQLKIPVYPEVRDPKYPWAVKEEMLLEDAIAANKCWAEKKRKFRIVCRTHGVGFAHHARSDRVHVSAPTVIPQGLQILMKDAATQTEPPEDRSSPRLVRSKSLPTMHNLDWP